MLIMLGALAASVPACAPRNLALSTESADGDFNGMSHGGTYLVIRNIGRRACSVPGLPAVTLRGIGGRLLAVRQAPVGMHPGPVIVPVTIRAGMRVAAGLCWVSGPVYDPSRKLDVRLVSLSVGGRQVSAPLRAVIFADGAKPATFEERRLIAYPPLR